MPVFTDRRSDALLRIELGGAVEWGARRQPRGIRADMVSPGPILIENGRWDDIRGRRPEIYERDRLMHPQQRMGTGDEIADVVAFLASPRASW